MDEMTMLSDLQPAEPSPAELAAVRQAVMHAVHVPRSGQLNRMTAPTWIRRRGGRLALTGLLVAAAITATVVALPDEHHGHVGAPAVPLPSDHHSGVGAPPVHLDAIAVLRQAAAAAHTSPDVAPRPDQFLYVKEGSYQAWLSMDGTHDGAITDSDGKLVAAPGCRDGEQLVPDGNSGPRRLPCTPDPAYVADAPTSESAMVAYLNRRFGQAGVNGIGKGVMSLLEFYYLRSAARVALFNAATQIPGLHLTATAAGPNAVGITWQTCSTGKCASTMLIFNRATHAYLGVQTTGINGEPGSSGTRQSGVVDHVGDRP